MKKYFVMFLLSVIAVFAFGQTTDSTAVVTYDFGDSFMEFLKTNLWTLVFVVMYFLSELIGESEKIPEGSIWRKVVNFLLTLARKKATESPKMKAMKAQMKMEMKANEPCDTCEEAVETKETKTPKKKSGKATKALIVAVLLSSFTIGASAQGVKDAVKGLVKPVTLETINQKQMAKQLRAGSDTLINNDKGVLILRFGATALGAKTNYSIADGKFVTSPFTRSGFGLTLSSFMNNEGKVYNNFGFGVYGLFPITDDPLEQYMSVMADISAVQLFESFTFNLGIGYDINKNRKASENFFIAPGIKVTF